MIKDRPRIGFTYLVETVRDGIVIDSEIVTNLIPEEGLNHIISVTLSQGVQVPTWYIGMYGNDYTPQPTDTMATLPALAGEITAYVSPTRHTLLVGAASGGAADNSDSRAEVEFTAATQVKGGFICSSPTKGANSGILISVVQLPSPKPVAAGEILRVTAGLGLIS